MKHSFHEIEEQAEDMIQPRVPRKINILRNLSLDMHAAPVMQHLCKQKRKERFQKVQNLII